MPEPCCPWCQTALGDHAGDPCLDAWVAESILGWRRTSLATGRTIDVLLWETPDGRWERLLTIPGYSTDIASAWQIVEQMEAHRTIQVSLDNLGPGWVFHMWMNHKEYAEGAQWAPLAICKAALRACLEEKPCTSRFN